MEDTPNDDPLPDRLRVALVNAVHACVPNRRDCRVAIRCLGLVADGSPATLAAIGEELGISRERVRQLRVRGFRRINAALSRRVFSAAGLRTVLIAESGDLDWTDPEIVAPFVVTNVSNFLAAATQLTVMCCKAAGAIRRDLLEAAENAAAKACRDPTVWEDGRFDRWLDSASKAIGALARFQSPPVELTGRKRMPRESNVIFFRSEKLRRNVAGESGSELRVISWLERSPEVVWYQEQAGIQNVSPGNADQVTGSLELLRGTWIRLSAHRCKRAHTGGRCLQILRRICRQGAGVTFFQRACAVPHREESTLDKRCRIQSRCLRLCRGEPGLPQKGSRSFRPDRSVRDGE